MIVVRAVLILFFGYVKIVSVASSTTVYVWTSLEPVVLSNEVNVLRYCTLSTIFEKSACNKVIFFWTTFTWNEVALRSNVLLRNFHFVAKYFVTL
jgi:hypothetical protein